MRRLNTLLAIASAVLVASAIAVGVSPAAAHTRNTCRAVHRVPPRVRRAPRLGCRAGAHGAHSRTRRGHKPRPLRPAATRSASDLARASTIATVLSTPCQYTALTPEPADLELVRQAVLCLINRERAQHGEGPLARNGHLEQAAEVHEREMIAGDYFQHVSPAGETPVGRVRAAGYIPGPTVGYVIGENLAWGTLGLATPQAIVEAWIASPPHLANILEGQYRDTGIAVVPDVPTALAEGEPGAVYTQEFGALIP